METFFNEVQRVSLAAAAATSPPPPPWPLSRGRRYRQARQRARARADETDGSKSTKLAGYVIVGEWQKWIGFLTQVLSIYRALMA